MLGSIQLQVLEARQPEDIERAFTAMGLKRAGALLVVSDAMFILQRTRIADLAAKAHLPAMYILREHMEAGGFAFYGPSMADNFRRAAVCVDKTAKALGLTIPPSLLQRADQVLE